MSERTPFAAVRAFRDRFRRTLLCVTEAYVQITPGGYEPGRKAHALTLAGGTASLSGDAAFLLAIQHYYRIEAAGSGARRWDVVTDSYYYTLFDAAMREIIGYHWHPHVVAVPHPHLHIGPGAVRRDVLERSGMSAAANALLPSLARAHLPTHMIPLEAFVRLLIAQFGVRPLRADWDTVLRD